MTRKIPPAKLIHMDSGRILAHHLEVARGPLDRMRGLLGRDRLSPGGGMLFEHCSSIHTFFMKFAIDVIFLDSELAVAKTFPRLRPWRLASAPGAAHVVELPAGALEDMPLAAGDPLRIENRT